MRSVADDLKQEQLDAVAAMTPSQRVTLVERMSNEALELIMAAQGVDREEAVRRIRRSHRAGRTPSRCHDEE